MSAVVVAFKHGDITVRAENDVATLDTETLIALLREAQAVERRAIVAWLRSKRRAPPLDGTMKTARDVGDGLAASYAHRFADAIERGES